MIRSSRLVPTLLLPALLLSAVLISAVPLSAHQQKESVTRILFNPRTGNIEVMHRFVLHDAEHAVRKLFGGNADILADAAVRKRFEKYVHERFSLQDQDGNVLVLAPVGHEIEGRFLWVYAEVSIPAELTALTLSHDALLDVWPDQVNLVNVERDKKVRSALFDQENREAVLRF